MLGLFNPFFSIISTQILHTSPIVSAVMRRRICFTVKTLHVSPFPFFLMTFNYVVIENNIQFCSFLEEMGGVPYFFFLFFLLEKTGGIF